MTNRGSPILLRFEQDRGGIINIENRSFEEEWYLDEIIEMGAMVSIPANQDPEIELVELAAQDIIDENLESMGLQKIPITDIELRFRREQPKTFHALLYGDDAPVGIVGYGFHRTYYKISAN